MSKEPTRPGRGSDQFPLRLPEGMRDRIKLVAEANGRSMNAEIVATLEEKYPAPPITPEVLLEFFKEMADFLADNPEKEAQWQERFDRLQEEIRAGRVNLHDRLISGGHGKRNAEGSRDDVDKGESE